VAANVAACAGRSLRRSVLRCARSACGGREARDCVLLGGVSAQAAVEPALVADLPGRREARP
jgi:hypothetical protein